jgi:RNA polymerase sigma-B factor
MAALSSETISASPDRTFSKDLAELDDQALLVIIRSLPHTSERRMAACELLVARYKGLVWSCVRRYLRYPELAEDLAQVGYVGLLKAINHFDPGLRCGLTTYAQSCIIGEIKRHFRDKRWQLHVQRPVQELVLQVRAAIADLTQALGRMPTEQDLTRHLGVSAEELRGAQLAELALRPGSLDAPLAGQPGLSTLADYLGGEDRQLDHMLTMQAVGTHWGELDQREQDVLLMDFHGGMTQTQIGQRLGISQMHVSRLRARALGYLRSRLLDLGEPAAPGRRQRVGCSG